MQNTEKEHANPSRSEGVRPEVLGGFRDFLPADALIFQRIIDIVRRVYESFGFVPLDTPGMERIEVLTGGKACNKSIFVAKIIRGLEDGAEVDIGVDQDYGLRFDLTVPLARVVAGNQDLPKPFKRYQIGKVWRGERPQAGRFREFYQFDFDIVGSSSILSDIEVIQVMYETMCALGIKAFCVSINTRRVLNGLADIIGRSDKTVEIFRVIDKVDKIGVDGVCEELLRKPGSDGDGLGIDEAQANVVRAFLAIRGEDSRAVISGLEGLFEDKSAAGLAGIQELKEIATALDELGIPQENWKIDLSIARGLDYYTGPVFETKFTELPDLGSVLSGGRFDGLTNRFIPGSNIPGVGASVGIDRLIVGMQKLGLLEQRASVTEVLVTVFSKELRVASFKFAQEVRKLGRRTEVFLGDGLKVRDQLAFASKLAIPFVVIIGPDEQASGKVVLKNMSTRVQEVLTVEECLAKLRK